MSPQHSWHTASSEQTRALGTVLGHALVGQLTIGLVGPLGAGKTHMVKAIAEGNGSVDPRAVTSPTFTLIHEYPGRLTLFHIDAYRLRGSAELLALGFDELIRNDSVVAVEWADRVREAMPHDTLWIELTVAGDTHRDVSMAATGTVSLQCLEAFKSACS